MSNPSPDTGVPILTDVPEQLPPLADPVEPDGPAELPSEDPPLADPVE